MLKNLKKLQKLFPQNKDIKDNMKKYIIIDKNDNVMVALEDFEKGDIVNNITILEEVKKGHKVAIKEIKQGENVIKYGYPIGSSKEDIKCGSWVHVHNVKTNLGDDQEFKYYENHNIDEKNDNPRKVNVYLRKNGTVGIRNELWILPTVGCVNGQAELLVRKFKERSGKFKYRNN